MGVEVGFELEVAGGFEVVVAPQVPALDWQPVPQYVDSLPHQPYCEQHEPNVEPAHV